MIISSAHSHYLNTAQLKVGTEHHAQIKTSTNTNLDNSSAVNITNKHENINSPATTTHDNPTYERPLVQNIETSSKSDRPPHEHNSETEPTNAAEDGESAPLPPSSTEGEDVTEIYTEDELKLIDSLKTRDLEVIAHERAHSAVGGQHAGSPSYDYKTGPDGVKYAVSGEVSIDTAAIPGDPQATLQKAQQIKAAALAPTEPSAQDIKVARKADQMASEARSEIFKENNSIGSSNTAETNENDMTSSDNDDLNIKTDNNQQDDTNIKTSQRTLQINNFYQNITNQSVSSTVEFQV